MPCSPRPISAPSYLSPDLTGLLTPHPPVTGRTPVSTCGGWHARWQDAAGLVLGGDGDPMDGLRAVSAADWAADGVTAAAVTPALAHLGW